MIARIKTVSPSSAHCYYTSRRDYEVMSPRWSGKLAQVLGIEAQTVSQTCLNRLIKGRDPNGEMLVSKSRVHGQQGNAISFGQSPPKERAAEDLILNAPKSISLEILVFGNRDLELAHQLANTRTLQLVEERYARTRITESGQRASVSTQSLIFAEFHHGTNRRLEPHRHTHNLILNLQQNPHTQRWQAFDNTSLRCAEKWIGQIYRNELAYVIQGMGYSIQITHPKDGRWELRGFSPEQLRVFSQRTAEIEAVAGTTASSQQKQFANLITRPAKAGIVSIPDIEREWQHRAEEIGIQSIQPTEELAQHNVQSQQQAMTQFLMWLQTFDRRDASDTRERDRIEQVRSLCREEIERFNLRIPGQFSIQELQQVSDSHFTSLDSGALSNYVQGISATISNPQPTAASSTAASSTSSKQDDRHSTSTSDNTAERDCFATSINLTHCTVPIFSAGGPNSSDINSLVQSEQPSSSSNCRVSSTSIENGNEPADSRTDTTNQRSNAADRGAAHQYHCSEEATRTNSDQQRTGNDTEAIESTLNSSEQRAMGSAQSSDESDCSRSNRHQEQPELISNPETVRLEDSQLEVER